MRVLPMPLDQRPIHRIGKQRLDVEESLIDDRRDCMDGNPLKLNTMTLWWIFTLISAGGQEKTRFGS
jgi:hypothetical protein